MNDLLKINFDTEQPTVSARDLHEALGIRERFSLWFSRYADVFENGADYQEVGKPTVVNNGAKRVLDDYLMSTDMAKHISMMTKTEKGKIMRQYFIDLEKAWNTPEQIMARALKMANQSIESLKDRCKFLGDQVIEQQQIITELQPKANYVDTILQSKSLVTITQIAKDYGMSGRRMNQVLKELKIQYKVATIFRRKETTVKMALDTFEKFGMIQRIDGVLTIPNWGKHQTLDQLEKKREYQRDYMRDYRAKQKEIADKTYCKTNSNANVSSLEEDIDIEEDKEYITVSKDTVRQTEVRQCVEAWNSLSEYGIKTISRLSSSSQRYQRLSARIKEYGLLSVLSAIEKVKGSSFLQGKSSGKKAWVITFDWFVLPNNFPKVLDGNYDDHPDNQKSDVEQGNQKWKPASKLAADEWQ